MAVKYCVEIAPAARREIKKLPSSIQGRVVAALEALQEAPRPKGVEKISGHPSFFRITLGSFRIIYHIRDALIVILVVRDRRDAYRGVSDLEQKLMHAMFEIHSAAASSIPISPAPRA